MVKIRLRRMGAKKTPFYRIVVADSRYPRDGRFIEEIGTYNPLAEPAVVNVNADRAQEWIKNGAQPTDTVRALLKKSGAIASSRRNRAKPGKAGLTMEELVRYIASTLVDHPEQVQVKTVDNPESVIIELSVGPDDMGKVIGKQGRIAKSIRSVVKAATARSEKPVFVEIL